MTGGTRMSIFVVDSKKYDITSVVFRLHGVLPCSRVRVYEELDGAVPPETRNLFTMKVHLPGFRFNGHICSACATLAIKGPSTISPRVTSLDTGLRLPRVASSQSSLEPTFWCLDTR